MRIDLSLGCTVVSIYPGSRCIHSCESIPSISRVCTRLIIQRLRTLKLALQLCLVCHRLCQYGYSRLFIPCLGYVRRPYIHYSGHSRKSKCTRHRSGRQPDLYISVFIIHIHISTLSLMSLFNPKVSST